MNQDSLILLVASICLLLLALPILWDGRNRLRRLKKIREDYEREMSELRKSAEEDMERFLDSLVRARETEKED